MTNNNLRLGIIGCGALSRIFYLPVLQKIGIVPAVLVDPDINGINELAKNSGAKKTAATIEESINDFDAAIIATPNFLHTTQAKYLLENGKHVLLEKPIASTVDEVKELIESAKKARTVLQPAMMRRFWKINKAVKKMLHDEILGELQTISMYEGAVLNWPVQSTAIFNPKQSLGGVFMDTGSHTLDLLCWWTGDEKFELHYEDDNHGGVETECNLSVNFINTEVKAEIKLSRIRNMSNEFILTGKKGWIKMKPYANLFETSNRRIDRYIYDLYPARELKLQSFEDLFFEQVNCWLLSAENCSQPIISAEMVFPSIKMIEQGYKHRRQLNFAWK